STRYGRVYRPPVTAATAGRKRVSPIIWLVPTRVGRGAGRAVPGGDRRGAAGAVVGPRADRVADEPAGEQVARRRRPIRERQPDEVIARLQIDVTRARGLPGVRGESE